MIFNLQPVSVLDIKTGGGGVGLMHKNTFVFSSNVGFEESSSKETFGMVEEPQVN